MTREIFERYIEAGAGTRLPSERRLAEEFGVSRTEIRKALARLQQNGHLSREIGRGTFIRTPTTGHTQDLTTLREITSPREAMEARLSIEPELAGLAAVNASVKQVQAMRVLARQMREAESWRIYEQNDGRLHRLIAESTGNKLMASIYNTVDEVRRAVVWRWLDTRPSRPPADYSSFAEHDGIIDAIEERKRTVAMDMMRQHLRTTIERLMGSMGSTG
jgi:DNA-binding FadR family transcriptional regulator